MKHTFFVSVILGLCLFGNTACTSTSRPVQEQNSTIKNTTTIRSIGELLTQSDSLVGQTVTISGLCTHTCKHGATKIFLMGSSDAQTLRIEAGTLGSFDTKCLHHPVQVTGILREERIDEGYLLRWEEKLKQEKEHTEDAGCQTEKNARGETAHTAEKRIADFRQRIAQRQKSEGKSYLSFYFMEATAYEIQP